MILTATDLMLDDAGQPVPLASGEEALAGGLDCFLQDIRLEALTMEGECFLIPITDGRCWISATGR